MMKLPESLPMHLMLAMMQSYGSNGGWENLNMSLQNSLPNFFPWLPKPKSPLEQLSESALNQWQSLSEPWLSQLNPTKSQPRSENSVAPWASFFEQMQSLYDPKLFEEVGKQAYDQATGFYQGLNAYLNSDYERPDKVYNILWERGSAQLLDLGPKMKDAPAVLCIPSLINKSTILDLYPGMSFVDYLKSQGLRPIILDWGTPGDDEVDFTAADYISVYAIPALEHLRAHHDGPIVLLGYCMGGIFSVAMAQLAPMFVDALVLLATPWDFSVADTPRVLLDPTTQLLMRQWMGAAPFVPPLVTQSIFHMIDPFRVQEKYSRYPFLNDAEKEHFLAVEHWVNDGVPLTRPVAEECLVDWPQGNILAQHQWKIGRRWIEPESIKAPALAVIPTRDKIVPAACALPLTEVLRRCDILEPDTGHVGMVVGRRARELMWEPVAEWIKKKF